MIQTMQPCGKRLLKTHKQIPRPELTTMSVTGELQVKARASGSGGGARLVGQEDFCSGVFRGARECGSRIAALRGIEVMRAVVRDSGHDQRRSFVFHHDVLIQEDVQTQSSKLPRPSGCSGVILVVARDDECAIAGLQPAQRGNVAREILYRAID